MQVSGAADMVLDHVGHKVAVVYYGDRDDPQNVSIECEDCCVVLVDFDRTD
jgi:hypothetical protein